MEHNSAALPVGRWQSMLRADHIAITAEITPPLSHAEGLLDKALPLRGLVDSVNATDGAGVRAHIDSRIAASILVVNGAVAERFRNIAAYGDLSGRRVAVQA
jgi:hypothetical protein